MKVLIRGVLLVNSFALAALVALLWGRSYFAGDSVRLGSAGQYARLAWADGVAMVQLADDGHGIRWPRGAAAELGEQPAGVLHECRFPDRSDASIFNRIGFGYEQHTRAWPPNDQLVFTLFVPHWALLLLFGRRAILWSWRRFTLPTVHRDRLGDFAWCPRCATQHEPGHRHCGQCQGVLLLHIRDDIATT